MNNEEIKLYEISDETYYYYRFNTRDNISVTKDQARKRITRDILCGEKYKTSMIGVEIVFYENLVICIEGLNVVWMCNVKGYFDKSINKELREELNKVFQII